MNAARFDSVLSSRFSSSVWDRVASRRRVGPLRSTDARVGRVVRSPTMAFAVGRRRALDVVSSAFASSARGLAATRVARRAAATTAAGRGDAGGDPDALCAQIVSYARSELRRGRRDVARGVLEHGASLVAKAAGGDAPAGAIAAAESRAHLAWAAVQSVRARSSSWLRRVVRCDAAREESNNTFCSSSSSSSSSSRDAGRRRARARARHPRGRVRRRRARGPAALPRSPRRARLRRRQRRAIRRVLFARAFPRVSTTPRVQHSIASPFN